MSKNVFVTGATGYIAKHIVAQLLDAGHTVTGSSRSAERDAEMREDVGAALADSTALDRYRTVPLDLNSDEGWSASLDGHEALIHTASPFPLAQPKSEDDLVRPAVDGTMRALRAAKDAGVSKVVMTSSSVAISETDEKTHFTEADWTDPDYPGISPYSKSKTLAERAAWDFVSENPEVKLAVINPCFVAGPPLGEGYGTTVSVIQRLLAGKDPMSPRVGFGICDVRDVAKAHVVALGEESANGHRHPIYGEFLWFKEMAQLVREAVPGSKAPTREAPDFMIRFLSLFDPSIKTILPQLGSTWIIDNARMREVLGIEPRDTKEAVRETARWLAART